MKKIISQLDFEGKEHKIAEIEEKSCTSCFFETFGCRSEKIGKNKKEKLYFGKNVKKCEYYIRKTGGKK